MKKVFFLIIIAVNCLCVYSQSLEAYPTSQRYLFNPYNRNNVFIDSVLYSQIIYSDVETFDGVEDGYYPCGEYQMYPTSVMSPVQVYGVAIPMFFTQMPSPRGYKFHLGYYWENDNLGPHDDSIRNRQWQLFVDSMNVLWSQVHWIDGYDWGIGGIRKPYEMYIYLVQKTDDSQRHIIITDSVRIDYGINATGWNRFQRPKLYNCTPPNIQYPGGYIVPTLEIYFDHPY